MCWQVGNHVNGSGGAQEVYPLDIVLYPVFKGLGLKLRNRVVWHFEHGLHCSKRLSGRHETIIWFTRGDEYVFNLDPIRVPQKYPGKKQYHGPRAGEYSCNPLGKNPGDVWVFPNVKSNHIEKTAHPCQFPIELPERLILSLTRPRDLVVDPFLGVGTTVVAALMHGRRAAGADVEDKYLAIARQRIKDAGDGKLKRRPLGKPVFVPKPNTTLTRSPFTR